MVTGEVPDRLAHGQLAEVGGLLEHDADAGSPVPGGPAEPADPRRVHPEHGHLAAIFGKLGLLHDRETHRRVLAVIAYLQS
ncbi:hypothetical protein [Micromonospora sp. CPCC 205556]|uniref:hypothetical protein n=1 Tax=Micromonospora sp. CPCC 205556 TaxID=3122398 RepID=UPI003FA5EB6E